MTCHCGGTMHAACWSPRNDATFGSLPCPVTQSRPKLLRKPFRNCRVKPTVTSYLDGIPEWSTMQISVSSQFHPRISTEKFSPPLHTPIQRDRRPQSLQGPHHCLHSTSQSNDRNFFIPTIQGIQGKEQQIGELFEKLNWFDLFEHRNFQQQKSSGNWISLRLYPRRQIVAAVTATQTRYIACNLFLSKLGIPEMATLSDHVFAFQNITLYIVSWNISLADERLSERKMRQCWVCNATCCKRFTKYTALGFDIPKLALNLEFDPKVLHISWILKCVSCFWLHLLWIHKHIIKHTTSKQQRSKQTNSKQTKITPYESVI